MYIIMDISQNDAYFIDKDYIIGLVGTFSFKGIKHPNGYVGGYFQNSTESYSFYSVKVKPVSEVYKSDMKVEW